jgi:pantetheine-phosphate adenylyltransferase
MQLSQTNSALSSDIKTVFLTTKPKYNFISSSTIKEIFNNNGDISKFVPQAVFEYLTAKKNKLI